MCDGDGCHSLSVRFVARVMESLFQTFDLGRERVGRGCHANAVVGASLGPEEPVDEEETE